jgi:hypothetical protein
VYDKKEEIIDRPGNIYSSFANRKDNLALVVKRTVEFNSKNSTQETGKTPYEQKLEDQQNKYMQDENTDNSTKEDSKSDEKDVDENAEKKGGRFDDVFKEGEGDKYEVHHMPADSTTELERNDGPAIKMDKDDHRETASCGNSNEARARQKELIKNEKFREALQMYIDDIHEKFGDKYDDAISEMLEYVSKLEEEGKV